MSLNTKINYFFILLFSAQIYAQQTSIKNISTDDGLPTNIIYDLTQDEIGYLWMATHAGLVKFDGNDFSQINKLKTNSIFIKNKIIYAGLENGLFIKNKSKEQIFESKKVLKIFSNHINIFVGTTEGIYLLKENSLQPIKINSILDFSIINDLIFYENSFYIASNNGLWKLDDLLKPKNIYKVLEENIISLEKFEDRMIAASLQNGLYIIDGKSVVQKITTLENITAVKKLKNEIWVTSKSDGIEVFVLPSFSFKQKINKYNSLNTNSIANVFKDNLNTTWIATNKGLSKIITTNQFTSFEKKPTIHFEHLAVNHQYKDSLLFNKKIKFLNSDNNIAITFKSVNLLKPKKIQYRYQLVNGFSPWSKNNTVQFPNLTSGRYQFQVQSKIEDKKSNMKSLSFTVEAPFYQKAWFIFTCIISLLLIGYLSLDYYLRKIHKNHQEKLNKLKVKNRVLSLEQKALQLQMNPHFIFNVLNGIKALGNSGKTEELNTTISKFSVLLRGILNNSRKEEITLQEEIKLLKNYIELEQRMSSKSFTYDIETNLNNIDADEILIPTMLLQPFIENCIQHAFQKNTLGKIIIKFEVKHHFLNFLILDNGIGIRESKKRKENSNHISVALKVFKERIENITTKNSFSIDEIIEDSVIKGTKIWFKIPLKTDY
ncbi:histidine kinase [Polaribacter litorisediminis]|uniref:sensor histidine kinase n=1 Tax=Polaribacter litorisediminis TaxID=1908341 RepID=UPI001CC028AA|nr:histidine kinase [Polaribacter litorisediminis]UAM99284.1 histidine kinase [Polaribacter litorisediminis]